MSTRDRRLCAEAGVADPVVAALLVSGPRRGAIRRRPGGGDGAVAGTDPNAGTDPGTDPDPDPDPGTDTEQWSVGSARAVRRDDRPAPPKPAAVSGRAACARGPAAGRIVGPGTSPCSVTVFSRTGLTTSFTTGFTTGFEGSARDRDRSAASTARPSTPAGAGGSVVRERVQECHVRTPPWQGVTHRVPQGRRSPAFPPAAGHASRIDLAYRVKGPWPRKIRRKAPSASVTAGTAPTPSS